MTDFEQAKTNAEKTVKEKNLRIAFACCATCQFGVTQQDGSSTWCHRFEFDSRPLLLCDDYEVQKELWFF